MSKIFSQSCVDYTNSDLEGVLKPYVHLFARNEENIFDRLHFVVEDFEPFFCVPDRYEPEELLLNSKIVRFEED